MSYHNFAVNLCNKVERAEAFFERGRLQDCKETHDFNHGLNRVSKWGVAGPTVRILYGACQVIGGLVLSIIFGIGALVSSKEGDYHKGHKMIAERSFKQVGHGFANMGRGAAEFFPGAGWLLFSRTGHDHLPSSITMDDRVRRMTYTIEDSEEFDLGASFYRIKSQ